MEGDRIRCLNKLFRALIVVFTLLQCAVNPSLSLGFKNISSEGVVRCFEREREALLAFKHGLVDHYHLLSSWGREEHKQDCCKWVGVHCSNRTNHVTQLHLGWSYLNEQKGDMQYIDYFLQGELPAKIGKLQALEILDLSRNQIDGRIPTSLARIDRLSVLDLSYNNFIGKIPTSTQLQSFNPSNYAGNPQLCGPPLQNMCDDQQEAVISSNEEEKDELITWGFYVSMALGFIVGFWGVCGSLIFIRQWRYSYTRFLNVLNDWLYVRVISIKRHFN